MSKCPPKLKQAKQSFKRSMKKNKNIATRRNRRKKEIPELRSMDADFNLLQYVVDCNNSDNDNSFIDKQAINDYIHNVYGNHLQSNYFSEAEDYNPSINSTNADEINEILTSELKEMQLKELFHSNSLFGEIDLEHDTPDFESPFNFPAATEEAEVDREKEDWKKTEDENQVKIGADDVEYKAKLYYEDGPEESSDDLKQITRFFQYELKQIKDEGTTFEHSSLKKLDKRFNRKPKNLDNRPGRRRKSSLQDRNPSNIDSEEITSLNLIHDDFLYNWLPSESPEYILPLSFEDQIRAKFHQIARHMGCFSKSYGPKSSRILVIRRTEATPKSYFEISTKSAMAISSLFSRIFQLQKRKYLSLANSTIGNSFNDDRYQTHARDKSLCSDPTARKASSARLRPGQIVGESAPPISESNVGNVLLRKLGWSPGAAIGKHNTQDPFSLAQIQLPEQNIQVVIRKRNSGLGM